MGAGGQVVGGGTVPEVRMDHDPEPFELFEVAVDGRQMHVGSFFLDDRGEVFRAVMSRVVEDGFEEEPARDGHPSASLAHEDEDVIDGADVVPGCVCAEGYAHDPFYCTTQMLVANRSHLPYGGDSEMSGSGVLSASPDVAGPTSRISKIRNGLTRQEWTKVGLMAATILGLNVVGWGMLALALHHHAQLSRTVFFGFGTGVLAYTLGMRHAFDADHIAAIDNTTRKLFHDGKRPLSVGYFFSLGHSTIVFVLAVLLNFGIRALNGAVRNNNSALHHWTGIVGTSISGTFLYLIGLLNLVVLFSIVRVSREMRQGKYDDALQQAGTPTRGAGADEPGPGRLRHPGRHAGEDVSRRHAVRVGLRHRLRGGPPGARRFRRGGRAALPARSFRCRSSLPPACASSTRSTGAS